MNAFGYLARGWKKIAKPEPQTPKPLYKPLHELSYDEFDDEIQLTYNGEKIIQVETRPRNRDRA